MRKGSPFLEGGPAAGLPEFPHLPVPGPQAGSFAPDLPLTGELLNISPELGTSKDTYFSPWGVSARGPQDVLVYCTVTSQFTCKYMRF